MSVEVRLIGFASKALVRKLSVDTVTTTASMTLLKKEIAYLNAHLREIATLPSH